jgi:hypothetical protein
LRVKDTERLSISFSLAIVIHQVILAPRKAVREIAALLGNTTGRATLKKSKRTALFTTFACSSALLPIHDTPGALKFFCPGFAGGDLGLTKEAPRGNLGSTTA